MDFYENGHVIDGLSEHFLPFPAEKRKEAIQKILEAILDNKENGYLLKDDAISLSRDFYMIISKENGINCTRKKRDNTCLMLTFFEESLCHVIYEFVRELKKSDLVESRETMIEFLESLL